MGKRNLGKKNKNCRKQGEGLRRRARINDKTRLCRNAFQISMLVDMKINTYKLFLPSKNPLSGRVFLDENCKKSFSGIKDSNRKKNTKHQKRLLSIPLCFLKQDKEQLQAMSDINTNITINCIKNWK